MLGTKQRFKEYDKKYARYKGRLLDDEKKPARELDSWPYTEELSNWKKPSHQEIARVVYLCGLESELWQKFRVSLKGWSTGMKLARVHMYRHRAFMQLCKYDDRDLYEREILRVYNYLDAMKRGGLINNEGKVLK